MNRNYLTNDLISENVKIKKNVCNYNIVFCLNKEIITVGNSPVISSCIYMCIYMYFYREQIEIFNPLIKWSVKNIVATLC